MPKTHLLLDALSALPSITTMYVPAVVVTAGSVAGIWFKAKVND